jgi:hypothetical protein
LSDSVRQQVLQELGVRSVLTGTEVDAAAVRLLLENLHSGDTMAQVEAAYKLGRMPLGERRWIVIQDLLRVVTLETAHPEVRQHARRSLKHLLWEAQVADGIAAAECTGSTGVGQKHRASVVVGRPSHVRCRSPAGE